MGTPLQYEIIGAGLVVVEEEILHRRGAVAETENEVGMPEMGVVPHDVPDQWALPDQGHGLGAGRDAIAHPHPESAAEENHLHVVTSLRRSRVPESERPVALPTIGRSPAARLISSRRFHGRTST